MGTLHRQRDELVARGSAHDARMRKRYRLKVIRTISSAGEVLDYSNGGMGGKTVLITGGTSGIGKATAMALAAMGANVVVVGRNQERGEAAVGEISARSHSESVDLLLADLSVQGEVRGLAEEFQGRHDRLDVLVNNAGLVQSKRTETPDGIEMTLAINHLAPFLLTNLLLERLEKSAPSRVITVSSEAQRWGTMNFDDMQSRRKYRGFPVYGMTKLANIMFTYELAERLNGTGVRANLPPSWLGGHELRPEQQGADGALFQDFQAVLALARAGGRHPGLARFLA